MEIHTSNEQNGSFFCAFFLIVFSLSLSVSFSVIFFSNRRSFVFRYYLWTFYGVHTAQFKQNETKDYCFEWSRIAWICLFFFSFYFCYLYTYFVSVSYFCYVDTTNTGAVHCSLRAIRKQPICYRDKCNDIRIPYRHNTYKTTWIDRTIENRSMWIETRCRPTRIFRISIDAS